MDNRKLKGIGLLALSSILGLASCGVDGGSESQSGSSGASVSDGGSSAGSSEALDPEALWQAAFAKDYSNMTVSASAVGNGVSTTDVEYYVSDYQIVTTTIYGSSVTQIFHDYNGVSYQWFDGDEDAGEKDGWLTEGYDGAYVGLGELGYVDARKVIQELKDAHDDTLYSGGAYYIIDEAALDKILSDCFLWAADVSVDTLYFQIDSETCELYKIGCLHSEIDPDENQIALSIINVGSTTYSGTLPDAPSEDNIEEYWQYKGWSGPQVHVYPNSIVLTPDADATPVDGKYVIELEKSLKFAVEISYGIPDGVEEERLIYERWDLTYVSSDESVASVDFDPASYDDGKYHKLIVGKGEGDAEIYVTAPKNAEKTETVESNRIEVHVNGIPAQNLENAVYNLTFDGLKTGESIAATNKIANTLPFDVKGNGGVTVSSRDNDALWTANVLILRTGAQDTMNTDTAGDAVVTFDFDDQQVNGISFYYGQFYKETYPDFCDRIAIETSQDGAAWTEIADITAEVKEDISQSTFRLIERSFDPAYQVRIVMEGSMIGKGMEMSLPSIAFMADDSCHAHVDNTVPVTAIEIAGKDSKTEVKLGKTLQILAAVTPNNASSKAVAWHVDDETIATIDENGLLTPLQEGTVKVTATSPYGADNTTITSNELVITVKPADTVPADLLGDWIVDGNASKKITVAADKATLAFSGETVELAYAGNDDDGYSVFGNYVDSTTAGYLRIQKSVSYDNQADVVVYVTQNGQEFKENVYSQSTTFVRYVAPTAVSISYSGDLKVGKTATVTASYLPDGAYAESYKIASSDTNVITVESTEYDEDFNEVYVYGAESDLSSDPKVIKGVAEGTATLTLTTESGLTDTLEVTVTAVKVTAIEVSLADSSISVGSSTTATADVTPSDAPNKAVTWSSSNTAIATVDANGNVTAVAAGECDIIATAQDGSGVTGSAHLTVTEEAPMADISPRAGEWSDGGTFTVSMASDGTATLTDWLYTTTDGELVFTMTSYDGTTYVGTSDYLSEEWTLTLVFADDSNCTATLTENGSANDPVELTKA